MLLVSFSDLSLRIKHSFLIKTHAATDGHRSAILHERAERFAILHERAE